MALGKSVFGLLYAPTFPGSSVVEQLTVNQLVAGSNPARGAIFPNPYKLLNLLKPDVAPQGLLAAFGDAPINP